jgi:carboxyl-terminal processing protease
MKKILLGVAGLVLVSLLITSCGGAAPSIATSAPPIPPTSTRTAPTASLTFTATVVPSPTSTPELLPISSEAAIYLNEALDIIENNSLHRESIDWDKLRQGTFEVARYAQTPADTYGAIRFALSQLGDQHSSFYTPDEMAELSTTTASDNPPPRGKLLLEKIGFIAIEGFWGFDRDTYATSTQQLIREIDAHNPCGWIVDLRENTGGSMWPMLAGLGPILGEGEAGAFIDPNGRKAIWSYQDGQARLEDDVLVEVDGPSYELNAASPPVAVLTGIHTGSSGEAIVVSFRGRPHTRSFGLYTAGFSTGNQGFPLTDGAVINLTTVVFADRTGQTYGDRIYPDEIVDDVRQFTFLMDEAIPQPAIDWLMSQPACSAQN